MDSIVQNSFLNTSSILHSLLLCVVLILGAYQFVFFSFSYKEMIEQEYKHSNIGS